MFTGLYFDGKSSKGHACQIVFAPGAIHITYTVQTADPEVQVGETLVVWDVDKIHKGQHVRTDKVSLKYGDYPNQYIEVDDAGFYATLQSFYPDKRFNASDFEFLRNTGVKGVVAGAFALVILAVLSYLFVLPPVAEYGAAHMPIALEEKLGDNVYNQVMAQASINQPLTKQANEFWRALHVKSPYLVNITVINEEVPNAFSLPGGQIIVYDGIIKQMKDYDEFAALLGHEYSHTILRHGLRSISRSLAGYIFISVLLNDASGSIAVLATNANSFKQLSFSRELEHQADAGGYRLLQQENIDPKGMLKLFTTLQKVEGNTNSLWFISNHPLTSDRISYIREELSKDTTNYTQPHQDLKDIWAEMKREE